jgi:hypothetical protein
MADKEKSLAAEATNHHRQNRGEACIRQWKASAGELPGTELGEEDLVDTLTDLFHFAKSKGWKMPTAIRCAKLNFEAELRGE